ncbi:hypothetical protein SAMD00019534_058510, partial [Acytostelium subglobosum LB1]|uniref:hypothetical protein n=1 Tax=Acytostelium subglobosum LB1 TaxID=1410327 RepID=UPI000644FD4F
MKRIALLFPGQGSQTVGMAKDLVTSFPYIRPLFEEADRLLQMSLSNVMFNSPMDELKQTEITQPAVLLHSYSILKILEQELIATPIDNRVDFVLGHSLGEYTSLLAARSITFEQCLPLVHHRGQLMKQMKQGKMAAVLSRDDMLTPGSTLDRIKEYTQQLYRQDPVNDICDVSNINSPNQIVISGTVSGVDKTMSMLKEQRLCRSIKQLEVSAAFHSKLMLPCSQEFESKHLNNINFKRPNYQVISNVTSRPYIEAADIKPLLSRQLVETVNWVSSIQYCLDGWKSKEAETGNAGHLFVEIGPSSVLTQLLKQISPQSEYINISTTEDIRKFIKM